MSLGKEVSSSLSYGLVVTTQPQKYGFSSSPPFFFLLLLDLVMQVVRLYIAALNTTHASIHWFFHVSKSPGVAWST